VDKPFFKTDPKSHWFTGRVRVAGYSATISATSAASPTMSSISGRTVPTGVNSNRDKNKNRLVLHPTRSSGSEKPQSSQDRYRNQRPTQRSTKPLATWL